MVGGVGRSCDCVGEEAVEKVEEGIAGSSWDEHSGRRHVEEGPVDDIRGRVREWDDGGETADVVGTTGPAGPLWGWGGEGGLAGPM